MDTILDALQEGRLIELPENDKPRALRFLAHVIEALPEVPPETEVVERVMAREQVTNTALGGGWACPHARIATEGELVCAIGWSPSGIDYGAEDGLPVHLVVMYLVPSNQRNHYLREVSLLAKALSAGGELSRLGEAADLNEVRNLLLSLIAASKETVGPDARARMIQLQARTAAEALLPRDLSGLLIEPVTLITGPGLRPVVLSQNPDVTLWLDGREGVGDRLEASGRYQDGGWLLVARGTVTYQGGRTAYDCLAIRSTVEGPEPKRLQTSPYPVPRAQ